jgi:L-iditol 2-dehydrogenase
MEGKMKAAVLHEALDMRIEEVDIPKIGPNDVLVRMKSVGICGSDIHYYLHGRAASFVVNEPLILGHECAGDVAEVGDKVRQVEVGQRVVIEPAFPCRKCRFCKEGRYNLCRDIRCYGTPPYNGAFAEYASASEENVYPMLDGLSYEEGAMMEPLAVGMMAAKRGLVSVYDTVAILGSGPIGLMCLQAVRVHGALDVYVTDIVDYRLDYAKRLGARDIINPKKKDAIKRFAELTNNEGIDVVIEATGSVSALQQAFDIVKPGGRIVLVGIYPTVEFQVPLGNALTKELDVRGVWRYANIFPTAIKCVSEGKIDVKSLITHRFPLNEIIKGFETQIKKIGNPMKTMISI